MQILNHDERGGTLKTAIYCSLSCVGFIPRRHPLLPRGILIWDYSGEMDQGSNHSLVSRARGCHDGVCEEITLRRRADTLCAELRNCSLPCLLPRTGPAELRCDRTFLTRQPDHLRQRWLSEVHGLQQRAGVWSYLSASVFTYFPCYNAIRKWLSRTLQEDVAVVTEGKGGGGDRFECHSD